MQKHHWMKTFLNIVVANVEGFMFQGANGFVYFVGYTLLEEDNIDYSQANFFVFKQQFWVFFHFYLTLPSYNS